MNNNIIIYFKWWYFFIMIFHEICRLVWTDVWGVVRITIGATRSMITMNIIIFTLYHVWYTVYSIYFISYRSYGNIDSILVQPGEWKLGLLLTKVEILMDNDILSHGCHLNILGGGQIFGELTWMFSNINTWASDDLCSSVKIVFSWFLEF